MNKFLMTSVFCASAMTFGGCSWFGTNVDGEVVVPYNLTTADELHYNTVGTDFKNYFTSDESLNQDTLVVYESALAKWLEQGSDRQVFETVAGLEMDGPYLDYVESDVLLTEADREARYLNVAAWELNVDARAKEVVPEEVVEETVTEEVEAVEETKECKKEVK